MHDIETFRDFGSFGVLQIRLESAGIELAPRDAQAFGRTVGRSEKAVRQGDRDLQA
jgi:hypothetical protein